MQYVPPHIVSETTAALCVCVFALGVYVVFRSKLFVERRHFIYSKIEYFGQRIHHNFYVVNAIGMWTMKHRVAVMFLVFLLLLHAHIVYIFVSNSNIIIEYYGLGELNDFDELTHLIHYSTLQRIISLQHVSHIVCLHSFSYNAHSQLDNGKLHASSSWNEIWYAQCTCPTRTLSYKLLNIENTQSYDA